MIRLFHCKGARSLRPLWMLEEMGLPYELESLPFPPRRRRPEYLDTNPLGTVPALFDGDAALFESGGACDYLGHRYGPTDLVVRPEEPGYADYVQFLHMGEATLTFPLTIVFRYGMLESEDRRLPQAVEDYRAFFLGRLNFVFERLERAPYLAADRFTAADITVGYNFSFMGHLGLLDALTPKARAYWDRLQARPAYERAVAR